MKYKTLPSVHVIVMTLAKHQGANCGEVIGERTVVAYKIIWNFDTVVGY
jgi:hypothetical protein